MLKVIMLGVLRLNDNQHNYTWCLMLSAAFSIFMLSVFILSVVLNAIVKYPKAKCHDTTPRNDNQRNYTRCLKLSAPFSIVMLSVFILSVVMLNTVMQSVARLNVIA